MRELPKEGSRSIRDGNVRSISEVKSLTFERAISQLEVEDTKGDRQVGVEEYDGWAGVCVCLFALFAARVVPFVGEEQLNVSPTVAARRC